MPLAIPIRSMPDPDAVRYVLAKLFDREVKVMKASLLDINDPAHTLFTATLIEDNGAKSALLVADLPFACITGAALVMIPSATSEQAIASGSLPESLRENFHEVINIATNTLNSPTDAHLRLDDIADEVPGNARDLILRAAGRATYQVTVPGYGSGLLAAFAE